MIEGFSWIAQEAAFVVVDKQPGVNFHSEGEQPGLVVQVERALGQPLWPVHRLDKMTSGLVLLARTAQAARDFGELFERRQLNKYYLAIGSGKPKKKQGLVMGDMARSRRKGWKLLTSSAQPAVTQFFSQSVGAGLRLYILKPHTGKTHQLRVALKSQGTPILGDEIYGGEPADRGYLHAYQLQFMFAGQSWQFAVPPLRGQLFLEPATQIQLVEFCNPSQLPWPALPAGVIARCL